MRRLLLLALLSTTGVDALGGFTVWHDGECKGPQSSKYPQSGYAHFYEGDLLNCAAFCGRQRYKNTAPQGFIITRTGSHCYCEWERILCGKYGVGTWTAYKFSSSCPAGTIATDRTHYVQDGRSYMWGDSTECVLKQGYKRRGAPGQEYEYEKTGAGTQSTYAGIVGQLTATIGPLISTDFGTPCTKGRYSTTAGYGSSSCANCGRGYYANKNSAATGCTRCTAGFVQVNYGADAVIGTTETLGCNACTAGKFSGGSPWDACEPCLKGTYNDQTKKASCTDCPAGRHAGGVGKTSCPVCPAGQHTVDDNGGLLTGQERCTGCKEGQYKEGGDDGYCTACGEGRYTSSNRQNCETCDVGDEPNKAGTVRRGPAALTATQAPTDYGAWKCRPCRAGYMCLPGKPSKQCPKGTFSASGEATCRLCPAGRLCANEGTQDVTQWTGKVLKIRREGAGAYLHMSEIEVYGEDGTTKITIPDKGQVLRSGCPNSHPHFERYHNTATGTTSNAWWCYETPNNGGAPCYINPARQPTEWENTDWTLGNNGGGRYEVCGEVAPVTVSSVHPDYQNSQSNVLDGKKSTIWCSNAVANNGEEWIQVDLGAEHNVTRVVVVNRLDQFQGQPLLDRIKTSELTLDGHYIGSFDVAAERYEWTPQRPCPEGHYCPEGSSVPLPCGFGKYCPEGTTSPMEPCTGWCNPGKNSKQTLPAGAGACAPWMKCGSTTNTTHPNFGYVDAKKTVDEEKKLPVLEDAFVFEGVQMTSAANVVRYNVLHAKDAPTEVDVRRSESTLYEITATAAKFDDNTIFKTANLHNLRRFVDTKTVYDDFPFHVPFPCHLTELQFLVRWTGSTRRGDTTLPLLRARRNEYLAKCPYLRHNRLHLLSEFWYEKPCLESCSETKGEVADGAAYCINDVCESRDGDCDEGDRCAARFCSGALAPGEGYKRLRGVFQRFPQEAADSYPVELRCASEDGFVVRPPGERVFGKCQKRPLEEVFDGQTYMELVFEAEYGVAMCEQTASPTAAPTASPTTAAPTTLAPTTSAPSTGYPTPPPTGNPTTPPTGYPTTPPTGDPTTTPRNPTTSTGSASPPSTAASPPPQSPTTSPTHRALGHNTAPSVPSTLSARATAPPSVAPMDQVAGSK